MGQDKSFMKSKSNSPLVSLDLTALPTLSLLERENVGESLGSRAQSTGVLAAHSTGGLAWQN